MERDDKFMVVGEASDGRQAVEMAAGAMAPDVVIVDIGMPGLNGVDATRQFLLKNQQLKVIALSAHSDRRFVAAMLEAGASAYVLKEAASDEIRRAVLAVHAGRKFLCPGVAGAVMEDFVSGHTAGGARRPRTQLAARERQIVQLLAEGKTSKEVASLLHISVKTVETHRRNVMSKLELHGIASLTKFAIREGLTSAED